MPLGQLFQAGLLVVGGLAGTGGVGFLAAATYYAWWYVAEPANPYRNEVQGGVVIGLVYAAPFWAVAALCAHGVRDTVPQWVVSAVRRVATTLAVAYAGVWLYIIGLAVLP